MFTGTGWVCPTTLAPPTLRQIACNMASTEGRLPPRPTSPNTRLTSSSPAVSSLTRSSMAWMPTSTKSSSSAVPS